MNEAASLILSENVSSRPESPSETAARGAAVALLARRGVRKLASVVARLRPPRRR